MGREMSGTPAGADAACQARECLPQVGRSAAESEAGTARQGFPLHEQFGGAPCTTHFND
jgi:hypothetical protein